MSPNPVPTLRWPPILVAWGVLALVFLPQAVALNLNRPEPLPLWLVSVRNLSIFLIWALLTPVALWAVRRWPPLGARRWRHGAVLVAVALGLCLVHLLAMTALTLALASAPVGFLRLLLGMAVGLAATNVLMAASLFAVGIALLQWQARRAAERQLAEARLAALRDQLQPHFLFNALNALAELVHSDPVLAESLLLRLSHLLRRALDGGGQRRVSLREELDFLDDYLAIQQALFGERLRLSRDIDDAALEARLPPMLLQPLVENALRHGLGPRRNGGSLHLSAALSPAGLELGIEDDGAGALPPLREGVGLRNTRERLATDYGDAAAMRVRTRPGEGFEVRLVLPQAPA